MTVIAKE